MGRGTRAAFLLDTDIIEHGGFTFYWANTGITIVSPNTDPKNDWKYNGRRFPRADKWDVITDFKLYGGDSDGTHEFTVRVNNDLNYEGHTTDAKSQVHQFEHECDVFEYCTEDPIVIERREKFFEHALEVADELNRIPTINEYNDIAIHNWDFHSDYFDSWAEAMQEIKKQREEERWREDSNLFGDYNDDSDPEPYSEKPALAENTDDTPDVLICHECKSEVDIGNGMTKCEVCAGLTNIHRVDENQVVRMDYDCPTCNGRVFHTPDNNVVCPKCDYTISNVETIDETDKRGKEHPENSVIEQENPPEDPVENVHWRYVHGEIGDVGLEEELEAVLIERAEKERNKGFDDDMERELEMET